MPTATISKTTMSGTKRKGAPAKSEYVKESKKAKFEDGKKVVKKSKIVVPLPTKKIIKKVEVESEEISEDSDSDGGVPVGDSNDDDDEDLPNAADGLHPERAKAVVVNSKSPPVLNWHTLTIAGQSSKEAHAKQKQLVQERKAAKPLAEQLARTKKLWERLRIKSAVPKEERKELVNELFEIITGKIKDFVLKHDSVRVVQTAIKYANPEQKRIIARELAGTYRQLAESRYAKFLIGKLLIQGDDEIRDLIVPEFFGHVRRLIKHPEASWILDDVYRGVATRQQKATILREWYGAEFALFAKESKDKVTPELSEILEQEPGKRAPIMRSLLELINPLVQKKTTGFTLLHDAMLQYFLNAKPGTEEVTDFLELIKGDEEGDLLKNLAFTRSGSRVVCLALAYGTAKDRKQILRVYKDTLQMMATDANGHIIILTCYEVIDDTVLTAKSIFPELLSKDADKQVENVIGAVNAINSRTTLLYPFQGRSKALFPPALSTDLEILSEIDVARQTTSKKDPSTRQAELAKALSSYLLPAIESAASDLVTSSFGCPLITEVMFGATGDKTVALNAIATSASGDPTLVPEPTTTPEGEVIPVPGHVGSTAWGGKMLKSLLAGGHFDKSTKKIVPVEPALNFADILYPNIEEHVLAWATGPGSFVINALLEADVFEKKDELLKILRKNKKALQKAATEETAEQKLRRETFESEQAAKIDGDGKAKGRKGKKKVVKERAVGNMGAAYLLEKL